MGETLNLLFRSRENGTFELEVKESWSGHVVKGDFVPPYTQKDLNALLKKLNTLESDDQKLRDVGQRLFRALCGSAAPGTGRLGSASEHSVQAVLRSVIQRTLHRRGTVALTLSFAAGCEEFIRYPWELLHNGEHFLLASGVFTLTRALVRPEIPPGCELPVYPPLRLLYIGASPVDYPYLETERSFEALQRGLFHLIEDDLVHVTRLEPPTYDELVRGLNFYGGAGAFEDQETAIPCYALHFDGHGAIGRLCPAEDCDELNDPAAQKCSRCNTSLSRVKAQTYLCFCDDDGRNRYIDTAALRELLTSSDIRLAVFSACDTAAYIEGRTNHKQRKAAVDATLATALVTSQVAAVVAMPFSLQDDLSPTFVYHFYDALAHGRTLEEALSRARQALLPMKYHSWFVPVLYRQVAEEQEGPVAFLAGRDEPQEHDHPLAHLGAASTFVGRERELQELSDLLAEAASGETEKLRPGTHHLALIGPAGIGKSELAFEVARRNAEKVPGGIIGISLQGGKSLHEALTEMAHALHIHSEAAHPADTHHRERAVLGALRMLANRDLPSLLLLDGFEEIQEPTEVSSWYRFLCALPEQVIVLLTSLSSPAKMAALEGPACRWYEYRVGKMSSEDLLKLFAELAASSGLSERIHLSDPEQQAILREICTLLDGYPLGAQLIFGIARPIQGRVFGPEAATRSLEEVRDELREAFLEGMWAKFDVAYRRLSSPARLLLPYLAAFKLPFSREQIVMLIDPDWRSSARAARRLEHEHYLQDVRAQGQDRIQQVPGITLPEELHKDWRAARDELVETSFLQFDGRVYTIHPQVRHFAQAYLSEEERRQVHRVMAAYYTSLPQPSPEEWFAAFEHLEDAAEPEDLRKAIHVIVRAAWALAGRGYASELRTRLRRAETYALSLEDKTGEGEIQYCLGAILRRQGKYAEALACLTRSLTLHRDQHERDEEAWALFELAMLLREQGQYQQAGAHAQDALILFRETGDSKGEAWMLTVLGEVERGRGDYYKALGYFETALAMFRALPEGEGYPWTLHDRATVQEALGKYGEALADYEESLRQFNAQGLRFGQAWVLAGQSGVYVDQAQFELAETTCNQALAIFREQRVRRGEAWALHVLGDIARKRCNFSEAQTYYTESAAMFSDLGDRVDQARVLNSLGAIAFVQGEYPVAKERYEHARALAHEQEARQLEGRALRGLGDVARAMRQFAEAARCYQAALAIAKELDTPAEHCAALHRLGDLRLAEDQPREALAAWVEALKLDQRVEHPERKEHQARVDRLVAEQHLEGFYAELCMQYGL